MTKGTTKKGQNKTVGKEVHSMFTKEKQTELTKLAVQALRSTLNTRIINTNRKYKMAIELVTDKQVLEDFSKTPEGKRMIVLIGHYLDKTFNEQRKEYYLNKAYGTDPDDHVSMHHTK